MNKDELITKYYTDKIQLSLQVINDILGNCIGKKMLVFGLGYDSKLWYNATNGNTYFIENNKDYIKLNENDIPKENILYYEYNGMTVDKGLNMKDGDIDKYKIPQKLLEWGIFDVIIVDGPPGYHGYSPGRLLPIYWSKKYLSKKDTVIYVDDFDRKLESTSVYKYYKDAKIHKFYRKQHGETAAAECVKIII